MFSCWVLSESLSLRIQRYKHTTNKHCENYYLYMFVPVWCTLSMIMETTNQSTNFLHNRPDPTGEGKCLQPFRISGEWNGEVFIFYERILLEDVPQAVNCYSNCSVLYWKIQSWHIVFYVLSDQAEIAGLQRRWLIEFQWGLLPILKYIPRSVSK